MLRRHDCGRVSAIILNFACTYGIYPVDCLLLFRGFQFESQSSFTKLDALYDTVHHEINMQLHVNYVVRVNRQCNDNRILTGPPKNVSFWFTTHHAPTLVPSGAVPYKPCALFVWLAANVYLDVCRR